MKPDQAHGMNSVTRIGIAGAGLIGRKHVELIEASGDCALVGIADPSPDARAFAEARTIAWYPDCVSLLDRAKPDGLIIASPNAMHLSMTLDCLERGVPVLLEKPVTDTVASAQKLLGVVRRTGVPVLVGHHRRYNPMIRAAREAIASGRIGQPTAVVGMWLLKKPDDYFDAAWRRELGGGPILINLVHDIDNLRFICGDIVEVQALVSNQVRKFEVEDTAALLLKFANGAIGTFSVSDATPAPWSWELASGENPAYPRQDESCYLFAGTKGSIAVPAMRLWSYPSQGGWYAPLTCAEMKTVSLDPLVEQLRHFLAVIARREKPLISVEDAASTLAVVQAVREAARTGAGISPRNIWEQAA
jgi:predicted dehydrogenase